nr:hypothetical protein [Tanacetum cinerariifolium]
MNNKKCIVNLEYFEEMLHICPRIPNQTFDELPFEEEILAFLRYLGHSGDIKKITDHKDAKKSNEMYYPRFTKVIINFFLTKDPSIPRNSAAYKEYYAIASGAAPPKTKANMRKMQSSSDTTMPPPTTASTRLLTSAKRKQPAKSSKAKGLYVLYEVALTEAEQMNLATKKNLQQTHISQASGSGVDEGTDDDDDNQKDEDEQYDDDDQDDNDDDQDSDNDGDDCVHPKLSTHDEEAKDEESFDPIVQTPSHMEDSDDESNDEESHGMNVGGDEGPDTEDDDEELYRDVNINLEGRDVQMTDVHTTQVLEDTHVTLTPVNPDSQQQSSSMSSQFVTSMFNPSPDAGIDSLFESTHRVDVPVTTIVVPLLVTAPTLHPPSIPIMSQVQQAPTPTPTTAPSTSLQDLLNFSSLSGFDHRLKTLEANFSEFMQTNQFAEAVSSIPGIVERYIDHQMNEAVKVAVQLQANRLRDKAQTENEYFISKLDENIQNIIKEQVKTSYVVAADLSELDLKKILSEKMESNKSIHQSNEQRNLYKALVDAYECDKIILDIYGDTVTLKRHRGDADKDEEPSAGSDRGVYKATTDQLDWSNPEGQQYPHNLLKPLPLITNSRGRRIIPFDYFINNDLEYLRGGASSRKYTTTVTKTNAADYRHIKWIEDLVPRTMWSQAPVSYDKYALWGISHWGRKRQQFYGFAVNRESARDVYSKRRIIVVTELHIVEWHDYKHMDWITVCRDDDKLYKFKEGDFKRLCIQDIEDIIVIQRRMEDLQLGVESYQKKLNLTNPDTYRTDLNHKEAYTAYSNPRGFIYQNKDKQNRLMRIDELHKFSHGTLNDVRTALDDRLKGIRMKYLPQTIWRRSDKERATAMIQAIDKQLKMMRIMRSLEKFVRGRLYEGDFRMLQRTL